jgi:modulator of FtsH protease
MNALTDWQTLFAVQAGAAATLTGLVFVAASINLPQILKTPGLPGRAAESMLQFLQVFFVSSAILIPRQSLLAAGCEIFFVTALAWLGQLVSLMRYARMRSGHPAKWLAQRVVTAHIASIPLFTASVMLMLGNSVGLFVVMGGFFFSFVAGIIGAWVLLIEILR